MGEAKQPTKKHKMSKSMKMIFKKRELSIIDKHLMNFRELKKQRNNIRDDLEQRKLQLRTHKRAAALQRRQSFLTECHPAPCSKSVHTSAGVDWWLTVANDVKV